VQGAKFEPVSLTHLSVTCSDFDKSYAFYRDVVGLKVVPSSDSAKSDAHRLPGEINCPAAEENVPFSLMDFKATGGKYRACFFYWGDQPGFPALDLIQWQDPGRRIERKGNDYGLARFALRVTDIEAAAMHLRAHGVELVTPPTDDCVDGRIFKVLFFRDPDGTLLQFVEFPAESG
jgi:catechol 2,3-dioxygenase-like lactoylglutathione lyase family enzyme